MKLTTVSLDDKQQLVLRAAGSSISRYLTGSPAVLTEVVRDDTIVFVLASETGRPETIAVAMDDHESQRVLGGLPRRYAEEAAKTELARLGLPEHAAATDETVPGTIVHRDGVVSVVLAARRWDFVIGRRTLAERLETRPAAGGAVDVTITMSSGERVTVHVTPESADDAYRAVALLNASRPSESFSQLDRWQYGVVDIGMFNAASRMSTALATLGSQGWELVTVMDKASNWIAGSENGLMILKRPIASNAAPPEGSWCINLDHTIV